MRQQYREQVGRELTPDEKSRINDLVYEFVRDLAVEQKVRLFKNIRMLFVTKVQNHC